MVIIDKIENLNNYPEYQKVWDFLRKNQGKIFEDGKYEIDERCYMIASHYTTTAEDGAFEGHLKNIDLQMIVKGAEYVQVQDKNGCELKVDYDSEKDVAFYSAKSWHNFYLEEGYFIVLDENDLHRACISVNGEKTVKKYVFKIQKGC